VQDLHDRAGRAAADDRHAGPVPGLYLG